jgi:hypothetical protein
MHNIFKKYMRPVPRKFIQEIAKNQAPEKSHRNLSFFIKVLSGKEGIALFAANKEVEMIYTIVYTSYTVKDIHYLCGCLDYEMEREDCADLWRNWKASKSISNC